MRNRNIWMLLLSIGVVFVMLTSAASADDWASFQGNNNNNGVTDDDLPTDFSDNWTFTDTATGWTGFDSAPVIGNGIAYYVYSNGTVFAFDLVNEEVEWVNTAIGGDVSSFEIGTPAYDGDNNRLYVGLSYGNTTTDTTVYALNAATGAVIWYNDALIPDEYQLNSPIKYDDGKIYVAAANMTEVASWTYVAQQGGFYCMNAATGAEIWSDTTGYGHYYTAPAITDDYVIISDDAGVVRSYDKNDGTLKDSFDASTEMGISLMSRGAAVIDPGTWTGLFTDDNMIFFPVTASPTGSESYVVGVEFNASTGDFGDYDNTSMISSRTTTSIAVSVSELYVASDDGSVRVYEIDRADEEDGFFTQYEPVATTTALGSSIKASPVVTTNTGNSLYDILFTERVYVTHNSGTGGLYWYEFDRYTNSFSDSGSWIPAGSGYTLQGIAAADGYITFGNDNKKVFVASA
jgi:outer membrane protein assembly factor BamB